MPLKLIDTHAHLNFNGYKEDSENVVRESLENGIWMINVGSQYATSKRAVEMAERYEEGVYAAIGLHPIHLETGLVKMKEDPEEIQFKTTEEDFDYEKYRKLAGSKRVVAIGETGFDYYWRPKSKAKLEEFKKKQREIFLKQAELAEELNLPLIIHCRMAHQDLLESLKDVKARGVIHCFAGSWEEAEKYLDLDFFLGFNGIIFKFDLDKVIAKTPLTKMLLETDCPYLVPPMAGDSRNKPLYIKYVAEKIAKIKGLSYEELISTTAKNARKLFNI